MPRRDKTFTGVDLVRIWARNLEPSEQADVLVSMSVAIAFGTVRKARSKLLLVIVTIASFFLPPPFGRILRLLLRFFKVVSFEEEARDFIARAERVAEEAELTLGDLYQIASDVEDE